MRATSAAPVAMALASSAMAVLPCARSSPIVPEPMIAARSSAVASASDASLRSNVIGRLADPAQLRFQCEVIEPLDGKAHEQSNARHDLAVDIVKLGTLAVVRAFERGRVLEAPMSCDGLSRP